jgi:PRTRC genetic system ThiF family protein
MHIDTTRHYRVALNPVERTVITLVGAGGTGSALAIDLVRLLYHCRQKDMDIHMQIVDMDTVEEKNVGRQQFSPFDIGQNKAVSMAERLNLWLGLDIVALPEAFTANTPMHMDSPYTKTRRIVVGAVDNHMARRSIHDYISLNAQSHYSDFWWVDAGNGEFSGQILVGNVQSGSVELDPLFGLVAGIPAPSLQMPALLEPEEEEVAQIDNMDCALLALRDEQSLNVNRMMAVFAAQAVYDIVIRQEVSTMATYLSLEPPSVVHESITENSLQKHAGEHFEIKLLEVAPDGTNDV